MGHALAAQHSRLRGAVAAAAGKRVLVVPGTDHAAISTNMKVEQKLAEEGLTRYELGREKFLERCWEWTYHYGGQIIEQLKALGCSYDWERTRFTLDEAYYQAGAYRLRALLRTGLGLSRSPRGELVPDVQLHRVRSRSRACRPLRAFLAYQVSDRGRGRLRDRGHHAPGDDVGRYRGGREFEGPALSASPRQAGAAAVSWAG